MKKIDLLDERSNHVKEVLETPPNKIISWGNTFFLIFIILILLLSWFIKYPDVVTSEVVITTPNPPVYLSTKIQGKIDTILKKNKSYTNQGEWLAVIGSNANFRHIKKLDSILSQLRVSNYQIEDIDSIKLPIILNVGEIQPNYNSLVKAFLRLTYRKNAENYYIQTELNSLRIKQYNSLISTAIKDREISKKELEVVEKDLKRNKILLEKGVIAQKAYEAIELTYFQAVRALQNNISRITQIQSQKASLLSEDSNMKYGEKEFFLNSELDILETIKLTELAFSEWQKRHVLISTVSGQVNYLDFFTRNQYIKQGERLISVIPDYKKDDYFGIAKMPLLNSGKVKKGQSVNIKLLGFPQNEYGVLLATVGEISDVPDENFYLVKLNLNKGLQTSFNKEITFKQNINGNAEIITDNLRLIERFVYTLTKAFQ
jgi:multidrug resistance efflux pump